MSHSVIDPINRLDKVLVELEVQGLDSRIRDGEGGHLGENVFSKMPVCTYRYKRVFGSMKERQEKALLVDKPSGRKLGVETLAEHLGKSSLMMVVSMDRLVVDTSYIDYDITLADCFFYLFKKSKRWVYAFPCKGSKLGHTSSRISRPDDS